MKTPWLSLCMAVAAACTDPATGAAQSENTLSDVEPAQPAMRVAFQLWSRHLLQLASAYADDTLMSIELDASSDEFRAKTELLKPTADEVAQGIRFRRLIAVDGGILTAPELSADGLALLLCHEFGHNYAGYPFVKSDMLTSAEGAADYFATQVCAPRLFELEPNLAAAPSNEQSEIEFRCAKTLDRPRCGRLVAASLSLIRALQAHVSEDTAPPYAIGSEAPRLLVQDGFRVARTVGGYYPSAQCRLDTLVRGALCGIETKQLEHEHVPSLSEDDALERSCSADAYEPGARPGCWYREGSIPTRLSDSLDIVWQPLE